MVLQASRFRSWVLLPKEQNMAPIRREHTLSPEVVARFSACSEIHGMSSTLRAVLFIVGCAIIPATAWLGGYEFDRSPSTAAIFFVSITFGFCLAFADNRCGRHWDD